MAWMLMNEFMEPLYRRVMNESMGWMDASDLGLDLDWSSGIPLFLCHLPRLVP